MKNLMIAAAVAAMVSGAFAGYDFTASVKTTKGNAGKQTTTYTVNCGLNEDGVYWWDSENGGATGLDSETFASSAEAKKYVKKLSNDEKQTFAENVLNFDGEKTDFNVQETYKNKKVWCYTFKYKVTDTDCYRVTTTRKLKGTIAADCCAEWEFVGYNFDLADVEITPGIIYRINGVTEEKSNKIEMTAVAGDSSFDGTAIGVWAVAGQGSYDVKNDRISSISGSIVGLLDNPDCEDCCDYDVEAIVYDCEGYNDEPNGTAAFGTWSIKYNKKYEF